MLYCIFKPLLRLSIRLFFKNYTVIGKENIPTDGPVIFAANHPATFMDAVLIAATVKQKVYFIAKSTVFRSRFAKWFLPKLNMIPVHRKQDEPSQMQHNDTMFTTCFKHLGNNKSILIFPEGVSEKERKIKDIKSGAARIALGATFQPEFNADVKIVCIGINYTNNGKFQTNVLLNIGEPIVVSDYEQEYSVHEKQAVKKLSQAIKQNLEQLTVSVPEAESELLLSKVEEMYKPHIIHELKAKEGAKDFYITKAMSNYLVFLKQNAPWRLHFIREKIDLYYAKLQNQKMNDNVVRNVLSEHKVSKNMVLNTLLFVLILPLVVLGCVVNLLPWLATKTIAKKASIYTEYRVAVALVGGMFVFLIYYGMCFALFYAFTQSFFIAMALTLVLPFLGIVACVCVDVFKTVFHHWKTLFYCNSRKFAMLDLVNMRKAIIYEFESLRHMYSKKL